MTDKDHSPHPSIGEELDRKTIEDLQRILHQVAIKRMTLAAADVALISIWNIASGLVPTETMNLVAAARMDIQKRLKGNEPADSIMVLKRGPIVALCARYGFTLYVTLVGENGTVVKKHEAPPFEEKGEVWAAKKLAATLEDMSKAGFVRIVPQPQ